MDPLTALGLVANIVPFIEIAAKVLRTAKEIHDSESGGLEDNVNLEKYATQLKQHYSNLLAPNSADLVGEDKELCALAAECRKLAQDLLDVLERIKPTDRSSKWQSFRSALKNMWRGKDKEMLEKRLESCRTQAEAQLNYRLSTKIVVALKRLLEATGQDAAKLKQIRSYVEDLREGVQVTSLSIEVQNQVSQLINVPDAVNRQVAIESFLGGLAFGGMYERFDMIGMNPQSRYAFRWMRDKSYDPQVPANDHNDKNYPISFGRLCLAVEERHRQRHQKLFADWLSFGEGIFHVSAKLGAGKSTLLWQLCDSFVIRHRLLGWAGERKLATGKFFFWNYGTRLQKSLAGLSRALLFDILQSFPELISRAFASRWEEALALPWQTRRALILSDKECIEGLELLIAESRKQDFSHRFCFFIDGLDELQETPEFTFRDLARTLKLWAQASGGNIKFCVSSRECYQFMDEFECKARIRLHELTKQDMISYVQERLFDKRIDQSQTDDLILAIVEKAQGIFLWVMLVTNNIREKLHDSCGFDDLIQEIDSLPDELEALFMHALGTLTRQDRLEAYKVFLLILEASRWNLCHSLTVLDFSFLKLYENNPRSDLFLRHKPHSIYLHNTKKTISEFEWGLMRCCKGLIEIDSRTPPGVRFTHRSVQEFLLQPDIQTRIKTSLPSFNTKEALSQIICLAQRAFGLDRPRQTRWMLQIMAMRESEQLDREPWVFLNSLDTWISRESSCFCASSVTRFGDRPTPKEIDPDLREMLQPAYNLLSPVFWLTFKGFSKFPLWWLRHTPLTDKLKSQTQLLISCAVAQLKYRTYEQLPEPDDRMAQICLCMVRTGLERGLITPDSAMEFVFDLHLDCPFEYRYLPQKFSFTVLETFLLEGLVSHIRGAKDLEWIGDVLEALLLHEASLNFTFSFKDAASIGWKHLSLRAGQKYIGQRVININAADKENSRLFSNLSPRDVVKKCNFHNKDRLLELLDGQMNRSNRKVSPEPRLIARYKPWARSMICHTLLGAFLGSSMTVVAQSLCS